MVLPVQYAQPNIAVNFQSGGFQSGNFSRVGRRAARRGTLLKGEYSVSVVILDHPRDRAENDHIAVVRINRPDALNALNLEVRQELARIFRELTEDNTVLAVVLTGDERAFAAGADLKEMADRTTVEMFHRNTDRLWQNIADYPKPVIAAINGYALGGGLELAMHSDIIVIGETAQVGQPEVRVGIMPGLAEPSA